MMRTVYVRCFAACSGALPPPLRGRVGEGGVVSKHRLLLTPLPPVFAPASSADLPPKGGGKRSKWR
jgi:hypothetical protein